jgi:hypothetical protein
MRKFTSFVEKISKDKKFFKTLSLLLEANKSNQEVIKKHLHNFFETIEYILNK